MKKAVENNNTYEQIVNNNLDLLKNVSDSTKILVETLGANEKLVQQAQKLTVDYFNANKNLFQNDSKHQPAELVEKWIELQSKQVSQSVDFCTELVQEFSFAKVQERNARLGKSYLELFNQMTDTMVKNTKAVQNLFA